MAGSASYQDAAKQLRETLSKRGITDPRVLQAIEGTPREQFVDRRQLRLAYSDQALSIGSGQTISQPYVVARMTELLDLKGTPGERVLEIGTGSGYQTAILSQLADHVVSIERLDELQSVAMRVLGRIGVGNVEFHVGDGSLGWPATAPYDAILVTAAAPRLPQSLYDQLKPGGRLVIPIGSVQGQVMQRIVKRSEGPEIVDDFLCRFVPLIGADAWDREAAAGWH